MPFCGAAAGRPREIFLPTSLTRAAIFVAGAALAATGCSESVTVDAGGGTDAVVTSDSGGGGADSGIDAGSFADAGGTDAGTDAGSSADAGFDAGFDAGIIALPYGTPPADHVLIWLARGVG